MNDKHRRRKPSMKTYVLVGTGYRGLWSYCEPLVREYADCSADCSPGDLL